MEQKLATHADAIVDITAAVASIPVGRDGRTARMASMAPTAKTARRS